MSEIKKGALISYAAVAFNAIAGLLVPSIIFRKKKLALYVATGLASGRFRPGFHLPVIK